MKKFMKPPIRASTVLQWLSAKLDKYKKRVVEMKEILSTQMYQHMFTYANKCEELFYQWSKYDRNNPLQ
jgi:hypothetical protein